MTTDKIAYIQQQKYSSLNNVFNNVLNNLFNNVFNNIRKTLVNLTINLTDIFLSLRLNTCCMATPMLT